VVIACCMQGELLLVSVAKWNSPRFVCSCMQRTYMRAWVESPGLLPLGLSLRLLAVRCRTGVNLLQVACASTRRRFPPGLARTIANKLLAQLPLGRLRPRTGDAALQVATPRAAISTGPSRRLSPSSCDVVQRKQSNVVNGGKPDFGSTIRCCIGLQLRHERPQVHSPS
jgi:hypothetical protein